MMGFLPLSNDRLFILWNYSSRQACDDPAFQARSPSFLGSPAQKQARINLVIAYYLAEAGNSSWTAALESQGGIFHKDPRFERVTAALPSQELIGMGHDQEEAARHLLRKVLQGSRSVIRRQTITVRSSITGTTTTIPSQRREMAQSP